MADQDTINQLKPNFTSHEQWQQFLSFIDTYKVRGCAQELWLQWEIHLLKCADLNKNWHNNNSHYLLTESRTSPSQFK